MPPQKFRPQLLCSSRADQRSDQPPPPYVSDPSKCADRDHWNPPQALKRRQMVAGREARPASSLRHRPPRRRRSHPEASSSSPMPFATTRSAFRNREAWRADGAKSCGSAPIGMSTSTCTASPATLATRSPRMVVVAITSGRSSSLLLSTLHAEPAKARTTANHRYCLIARSFG